MNNSLQSGPKPAPASFEDAALAHQDWRVEMRKLQLQVARWFADVDRTRAYREMACSSIGDFGESQGYSSTESRWLLRTAHAIALDQRVEPYFLEGRLTLEACALLPKALALPKDDAAPVDWIERATAVPANRLYEEICERAAKTRPARPPTRVVSWLAEEDMRKYRRARRLLCRQEKRLLTDGEVLALLAAFFVKKRDRFATRSASRRGRPVRIPAGSGATGSGAAGSRNRTVPADVEREVRNRDQDRCVVGLCPNTTWLDRSHVQAYRDGGPQTVENLTLNCHGHNHMEETGDLKLVGDATNLVCLDRLGRVVPKERRPMERRQTLEQWMAVHAPATVTV